MRIVFPKIFSVRNKISQDSGLRPSSWEILFLTSKIFGNIIFFIPWKNETKLCYEKINMQNKIDNPRP